MSAASCLAQFLKSGNVPHALLFCGPKGEEKQQAAYRFALDLLETQKKIDQHPDIHLFFPEGKIGLHSIESLRTLMREVALVPYMGKWKIFIIHGADQMLPTSSHSLLKTLEEPAAQTVIILLSDHPERLLPTLVSRCCTLFFPDHSKKKPPAELLSLLSDGWDVQKAQAIENEDPELVFATIMQWYRDRFLIEIGGDLHYLCYPDSIELIKKTPLIPLDHVEKRLKQARLAYDRSTRLSVCLEILLLSL